MLAVSDQIVPCHSLSKDSKKLSAKQRKTEDFSLQNCLPVLPYKEILSDNETPSASSSIKTLSQTILSSPDSTTHLHCRSSPGRLAQYSGCWCRMTLPHCWNGYGGPENEPSSPAFHR